MSAGKKTHTDTQILDECPERGTNEALTRLRCIPRCPEWSPMAQEECLGGLLVSAIEPQRILRRFSVVMSKIAKT